MRRLNFNVTSTAVTPNTADIGNEGEHNVTHLDFEINDDKLGDIEYYRLSVGNFRSKKLYAEDSIVRFTLPMAALRPGVVLIQLDGYKTDGEEVTLVFKSGIITASVAASLCPSQDIPTKIKSGVESAINELKILVENGNSVVDEFYDKVQQVRDIAVEVKNISGEIEISGDRAEEAALRANNGAAEAAEYAATSHLKCEETKLAASNAETYARNALSSAGSAEASAEAAKGFSEAAENAASQAGSSAAEAKEYMVDAAGHAQYSGEMANNISAIVGSVVGGNVASSCVYKSTTPDWQFGDAFGLGFFHYVEFTPSDIRVGEKVTVRIAVSRDVYIAPDELPITAQINIGDPTNYEESPIDIGACNMYFDSLTRTFYGSFTISDDAAQYDGTKPWVLMFFNHLCETSEMGSVTVSYDESKGYYELRDEVSEQSEKLQYLEENKADKEIHNTVLRVASGDWLQSTVHDYPYIEGKYFVGKAVMKAVNGYDIKMKIQSEYLDCITEPVNVTIYFGDYVKTTSLGYNEETGFFEGLFLYGGTTGIVDVMFAVEYPQYTIEEGYAPDYDYNAVFGEAEIHSTMPLELIVEEQNKNLAAIGGDIETALDGIIAIQEELIGGDSE